MEPFGRVVYQVAELELFRFCPVFPVVAGQDISFRNHAFRIVFLWRIGETVQGFRLSQVDGDGMGGSFLAPPV